MSNSRPNSDYLRLCKALEKRDNATARKLIQNNVNVNVSNVRGHTPLHLAIIKFCDLNIIKMLLDRGVDIHAKNHHSHKPLQIAIHNHNTKAISLLIKRGALVGTNFNALLLKVIKHKKFEVMKILIDHELQNNPSTDLKIYLNVAISQGQLKMVECILPHCKFVKPSDQYIPRELITESTDYNKECVELLLKWNFIVNPDSKQDEEFIYAAVKNGYVPIVLQLLELGIDVNMVNVNTGLNLLKVACLKRHYEIVEALLKHKACINETTPTDTEYLNDLSQYCFNSMLSFTYNKHKCREITCLHIAVLNSDLKMTKLLLKYGATIVDDPTFFNITCVAVLRSYEEIVHLFLDRGVNINDINSEGKSLLHFCVSSHSYITDYRYSITKLLLEKGATNHIHTPGNSLLFTAIKNKCHKIAQLFLDYDADIQYIDQEGTTLLHKAIENNFDAKFIKTLLEHDFPVNVLNDRKLTPLLYACEYHSNNLSEIVKPLLDHNADVNSTNDNMMTPLHFACLINNLEVVVALLEKGANPNATNYKGQTPLHCVCGDKNINRYIPTNKQNVPEIIELLLQHNTNIEAVNIDGLTPLFLACKINNDVAVKCLLDNHANTNYIDSEKLNLISIALNNCTYHTEILKILLERKVNVNYIDEQGKSIVHMIVKQNKEELIKCLAHGKINFNSVDKTGDSPLHIVVVKEYINVARNLIKYGANVNILNKNKQTPLRTAMMYLLNYQHKYRSIRNHKKQCNYYNYDDYGDYFYLERIIAYKKITKFLKIHVVKLKVAGLKVNNQNFDIVYNSDDNEIYKIDSSDEIEAKIHQLDVLQVEVKCEREIEKMKMESVGFNSMTFYDLLTKNIHYLSKFVKNKIILQTLEQEFYDKKFPLYINIVRSRFRDAKFRCRMMSSVKKCFTVNINQQLPDDCIDLIFSYLKMRELNMFIRTIKRLDG